MTLRDKLAAYAHDESWTGWMEYLFGKCVPGDEGTLIIPADLVDRYQQLMNTSYDKLSTAARQSDLAEADKMIAIVVAELER